MKYALKIIHKAQKDLDSIKGKDFNFIKKKILSLSSNPRPFGCNKLIQEEGYRIRAGNFRVLYRINDSEKQVIIYRVKHRKQSYR
ncbi:MAG: type II toxin-antitoxin system RelE/ParE family toxin [Candidatus Orphnella occulta]|nr:type II toxin-antitoxin system RelE/ParE family toxin [Candidatus Orphnella occulta]MDP8297775.1 type II toxin-antitoxin system RelE/ParE family toxin [Candidatus Orphnella occulta]